MAGDKQPNFRLAAAMRLVGFTNKSLARAVMEASRRRGKPVSTDHTRIRDWLAGRQPRPDAVAALLLAFELRTGRAYTAAELGLRDDAAMPPDLGLVYEKSLNKAVSVLTELIRHDLNDHPDLRSARYSVTSLHALCLDWLLGQDIDELPSRVTTALLQVHVEELRAMRENADMLDRRFGGEQHRAMAVRYLHEVVTPRLAQIRDDATSREYLREAAILCELIGWMSYDAGHQSAAQRYFAKAVQLAQAAGDEGYAAFAVTSMADQALYIGHPDAALRLSIVAERRTARGLPTVALLEGRIFQARANAALGDAAEASARLADASRLFEKLGGTEVPSWGSHWSRAVLLSHTATAWLDLGDPTKAAPALEEFGQLGQDQPRRRLYLSVQRSRLAALQRDAEAATQHAHDALDALPSVHSRRSWHQAGRQVDTLAAALPRDPRIIDLREHWQQVKAG
jgi:tetratricopeptide (TPR) repeat protein